MASTALLALLQTKNVRVPGAFFLKGIYEIYNYFCYFFFINYISYFL